MTNETIDSTIARAVKTAEVSQQIAAMIERLRRTLLSVASDNLYVSDTTLYISNLSHADKVAIMQAVCAGEWSKSQSYDGRTLNYSAIIGDIQVYLDHVEAPPLCRIIEKKVLVPAVAEHYETRFELDCGAVHEE